MRKFSQTAKFETASMQKKKKEKPLVVLLVLVLPQLVREMFYGNRFAKLTLTQLVFSSLS